MLDSMVVRAHVSAAGAPPEKEAEPALGRSRPGCGTQIHILADRRGRPLRLRVTFWPLADSEIGFGRPLRLRVTGGQRHDSTQARALVEDWTDTPLPCLIADRA